MWYSHFYKFAASQQEYLQSLGLDDNIISFVSGLPPNMSNKLTGFLTQNPQATITDLQEKINQLETKKDKNQLTPRELSVIERYDTEPIFYNWAAMQIRKARTNPNFFREYGEYNHQFPLLPQERNFDLELRYIYDWFSANDIQNINDFSLESAVNHEQEWHRSFEGDEDSSLYYTPTKKENIVYGPKWKNPEWQGWTIQKVDSDDLDCESDKMHHCVKGYKTDVDNGRVTVYSLRDPSNHPHITIGMTGDTHNTFQYQGVNNSDPTDEQKAMIREWFMSLGDVENDTEYNNPNYDIYNFKQLNDLFENGIELLKEKDENNSYDSFGFFVDIDQKIDDIQTYIDTDNIRRYAQEYVNKNDEYVRDAKPEIDQAISTMLLFAYELAVRQFYYMKNTGKIVKTKLEELIEKSDEELMQLWELYEFEDLSFYTEREDDESDDEYEERLIKIQDDEIKEYIRDHHPYYIAQEILDQLKTLKNGEINKLYYDIVSFKRMNR